MLRRLLPRLPLFEAAVEQVIARVLLFHPARGHADATSLKIGVLASDDDPACHRVQVVLRLIDGMRSYRRTINDCAAGNGELLGCGLVRIQAPVLTA